MNWIKRLLQIFQTDDEDPIEIKKPEVRPNKHLEARVTYEYPKGNFRFPIIPDSEIKKNKNGHTETKQTRNVQTQTKQIRRASTSQPKKNTNPKPTVKVNEKQPFRLTETPSPVYGLGKPNQKEVIEYELPSTPITDTESIALVWKEAQEEVASTILHTEDVLPKPHLVPSEEAQQEVASLANQLMNEEESVQDKEPIIDTVVDPADKTTILDVEETKTSKVTDMVEIEPISTDRKIEEHKLAAEEIDIVKEKIELESEITQQIVEQSEQMNTENKMEEQKPAVEEIEIVQEKTELESEISQQIDEQSEPINTESKIEEQKPAAEEIEIVQEKTELESEISQQVDEQSEPINTESKIEEQSPAVKEIEIVQEKTELESEISQQIVEQSEPINTESKIEEQKPAAEEIDIVQEKTELEPGISQQPVEHSEPPVTEEVKKPETETNRQPRRSNIPFNVMMFKKDKQKLAERKAKQKTETVQVKPTDPSEKLVQPVQEEQQRENAQPVHEEQQGQHEQPKQDNQHRHQQPEEQQSHVLLEDTNQYQGYSFPDLAFLNAPPAEQHDDSQWLLNQRNTLDETLRNFKVGASVVNVTQGPAVTRFEVHPEPGVKVNKITNLSDDLKLSLAAKDIRIEAPIPGKNTIGIEVPNRTSKPVLLKEIIESPEFTSNPSPLTVAMGLDISGRPIVTDLQKMPHGLIAGATGSGKSVCINAMLVSLLYKASPDEVKLLLIDPKMVELAPYNHIPHLVSPVITDVKAATASLKWAVEEMERRYELFAHSGVRDIGRYNEMVKKHDEKSGKLPYIVIIIDELADLMMIAPGEVEEYISRIAQKARACGIHLILATQRPSVDVITGLIKANIPTRIAFSVSSQVDSRTILDSSGAEKLLGKGDMLFLENGSSKPFRVQGNFVTDEEIEAIVEFVRAEMKPSYMFEQDELLKKASISSEEDELFLEACEFVLEQGGASTSSVQRRFRIGYNRAARLIDVMEEQGIISESRGSKPREVLIDEDDLAELHEG